MRCSGLALNPIVFACFCAGPARTNIYHLSCLHGIFSSTGLAFHTLHGDPEAVDSLTGRAQDAMTRTGAQTKNGQRHSLRKMILEPLTSQYLCMHFGAQARLAVLQWLSAAFGAKVSRESRRPPDMQAVAIAPCSSRLIDKNSMSVSLSDGVTAMIKVFVKRRSCHRKFSRRRWMAVREHALNDMFRWNLARFGARPRYVY